MVRSGSSINADVRENILENYKNDACLYYFCTICTSCGLFDIAAYTLLIIPLSVKYHCNRPHEHTSSSLVFGVLCCDMWTVICLLVINVLSTASNYSNPYLCLSLLLFFINWFIFRKYENTVGRRHDCQYMFRKHKKSEKTWSAYIKKTNYNTNMKTWTR